MFFLLYFYQNYLHFCGISLLVLFVIYVTKLSHLFYFRSHNKAMWKQGKVKNGTRINACTMIYSMNQSSELLLV